MLRTIESAFEVEGFEAGTPVDSGGERRSLFDTYAQYIDWSDPGQVRRAIAVFEEMLSWAWDQAHGKEAATRLVRVLARDGYEVDEHGRIRPSVSARLIELHSKTCASRKRSKNTCAGWNSAGTVTLPSRSAQPKR